MVVLRPETILIYIAFGVTFGNAQKLIVHMCSLYCKLEHNNVLSANKTGLIRDVIASGFNLRIQPLMNFFE